MDSKNKKRMNELNEIASWLTNEDGSLFVEYPDMPEGLKHLDYRIAAEKANKLDNAGQKLRFWICYRYDLVRALNDRYKALPDETQIFETNYNWDVLIDRIDSKIDELKSRVKTQPFKRGLEKEEIFKKYWYLRNREGKKREFAYEEIEHWLINDLEYTKEEIKNTFNITLSFENFIRLANEPSHKYYTGIN